MYTAVSVSNKDFPYPTRKNSLLEGYWWLKTTGRQLEEGKGALIRRNDWRKGWSLTIMPGKGVVRVCDLGRDQEGTGTKTR